MGGRAPTLLSELRSAASLAGQPLRGSATQTETLDEAAVAGDVGLLHIVEQPTPLADEQQQAATAVVVVLVVLQMTCQVRDPLGEQRHLHLWGTGVTFAGGV